MSITCADCVFVNWGGASAPIAVTLGSSASISNTLFQKMHQTSELVDVSFNGLVQFHNVTLLDIAVPPSGRIVGTTINDFKRSLPDPSRSTEFSGRWRCFQSRYISTYERITIFPFKKYKLRALCINMLMMLDHLHLQKKLLQVAPAHAPPRSAHCQT